MAKPAKKSSAQQSAPPGFVKRNRFVLGLVALVFIVFGNAIFNWYALDDEFFTNGGNGMTMNGIKAIPEIFKSRTFYNADGTGYEYRPITASVFAIEHAIFGQRATVSHFINVLLYALIVVLLFKLLRKWFPKLSPWFAFLVSVLFLVHPLHTEVVDNIKCRDELLCMLGALGTLYFAWKHYETGKWFYWLLYPLAFWFAMLSKHSMLPYLAILPMMFYFFTDIKWWRIGVYVLPLFVPMIITGVIQQKVLPKSQRELLTHENPLSGKGHTFNERSATSAYVMGRYLLLHVIPHPLVYYYGYEYVPIVDWSNFIAILAALVHIALGVYALLNLKKKTLLSFAIFFYLANIAMFSNLLRPSPGLMAERFTFSSTIGFCIAAVWLIFKAFKVSPEEFSWPKSGNMRYVLIGLIAVFAIRSIARNEDWENKVTLYEHDMEYLDDSGKAHMLYASLISSRSLASRHLDSLHTVVKYHFRRATEIVPDYATAWSNLGSTFYFLGEYDSAQFYFRKAANVDPDYEQAWFNLGMAYTNKRNSDSALYCFLRGIKADSSYIGSYEQVCRIYVQRGDYKSAIKVLREGTKNNTVSDLPYINLSRLLMEVPKDTVLAAKALEMAAHKNPRNIQRLENMARYFSKMHMNDKAAYYDSMYKSQKKIIERQTPKGQGKKWLQNN